MYYKELDKRNDERNANKDPKETLQWCMMSADPPGIMFVGFLHEKYLPAVAKYIIEIPGRPLKIHQLGPDDDDDDDDQARSQDFQRGGGGGGWGVTWSVWSVCMHAQACKTRGCLGACSPRKFLEIRCSEIASEAILGQKQSHSIAT